MNIVDLFLIIIIAVGAFKGFRQGLVYSLGGLFGWVISLIMAVLYSPNLKIFLDSTFQLTSKMGGWFEKHIALPNMSLNSGADISEMQYAINNLTLPQFIKNNLTNELIMLNATGNGPESINQVLGYGLAGMLVKGIAFLILFFLISILIKIFLKIISRGLNATFLGGFNRLAGLIIGIGINSCILAIVIGVLYPLFTAGADNPVTGEIQSSFLIPVLLNIFAVLSTYILGFINL
jgi:hypothetical protein